MNPSSGPNGVWSWIVVLIAGAITIQVVWAIVEPLLVPLAVAVTVLALVSLFVRYFWARSRW